MSSLVYPVLPGLTFGNTRTPVFNTGVQAALSGKESRIAYQIYPLMTFELQYELLRDYVAPSDIKALVGLFMACRGKFDTFLFADPAFNTVAFMFMGYGDGSTTAFQTLASYANPGGAYGQELIQNFNTVPAFYESRYGLITELLSPGNRTQYLIQSQNFPNAAWNKTNLSAATSATSAPDGTSTAADLTDTSSANVSHLISCNNVTIPSAVGTYTFSIFVYNVGTFEVGFAQILLQEQTAFSNAQVWVNLTTGAITSFAGTNWSGVSGTVQSQGAGWLRISITATKTNAATAIQAFYIPAATAGGTAYTGTNGAKAATIWGAQLENTVAPTIYLPTTTTAITQLDYTLGATGIITLAANVVPASTTYLTWSGSFYYRCRFDDDSMTASQFANQFWENKKVTLRQVKL